MELKFSHSQKLTHLDLQILQIGSGMTELLTFLGIGLGLEFNKGKKQPIEST